MLLPTGVGAAIAFLAVSAYGRVPTMLNFTSGDADLKSAIRTAEVKRVVTAHRFIELGKLEERRSRHRRGGRADLSGRCSRQALTVRDKLSRSGRQPGARFADNTLCRRTSRRRSFSPPAPKASPKAWRSAITIFWPISPRCAPISIFTTADVLFNPLPVFHCFGLTVGMLLPLIAGVKVVCHPTPLQPREIVRRIRDIGATILLSTDTFITQYARAGESGDLDSLRLAVCGAERVRDETRTLFRRKYGMEILEGYGVTEAVAGGGRQPDRSQSSRHGGPIDGRHGSQA